MLLHTFGLGLRNAVTKTQPILSCSLKIENIAKPNEGNPGFTQRRNISCIQSRHFRDRSVKKPAPWPYKEKKYTFLHGYIDDTMARFDDNTRLLVVDGNIASGKSTFAKKLAEELEMEYFPEVNVLDSYINEFGFDVRSLDHLLPESLKTCDLERFLSDPHNPQVANFQFLMYSLRYEQYIDALAHLLNTGNGVVLERSVYSDFVFMEAMYKMNYISSAAKEYYNVVKKNTMLDLLAPHLVIYLDVPANICLERIQKRSLPHEKSTKVLTKEYLGEIEHQYKHNFLKDIGNHSEILMLDWSNYGDIEAVIDDIEKIDFDNYDKYDLKLRQWRISDNWEWNTLRRDFTNSKTELLMQLDVLPLKCPEAMISGEDQLTMENILAQIPEFKRSKGFNEAKGDKGILFNSSVNYWDKQKLRLRLYNP